MENISIYISLLRAKSTVSDRSKCTVSAIEYKLLYSVAELCMRVKHTHNNTEVSIKC